MAAGMVLRGKKMVVVGSGDAGLALARFLIKRGAQVLLVEPGATDLETLQTTLSEKIDLSRLELHCGELLPTLWEGAQALLVTPGQLLDTKALEAARAAGVPVLTELEFASLYIEEPLLAVGGTKGKSTTAALAARLLELSGKNTYLALQQPLSEYLNLTKKVDVVVTPANTFQLEGATQFKPQVVALLNVHEDHANRYPNFESYQAAQREILKNIDGETTVVVNAEDPHFLLWLQSLAPKEILYFSSAPLVEEIANGAWASGNQLQVRWKGKEQSFSLKNFRLRGQHNRENLAAAVLSALSLGADLSRVQDLIDTFSALPSRVEFVKRSNSVAFYNDSCATSVQAVIRTLQSFNDPLILIMGGRDKNADYAPLIPHVRHRVKNLVLVGEAKEKINRALGDFTETFLVGTLEEAALMAYQKSRSGDVVLLSPGCDSRDVYVNHEDRGEHFKRLVAQMLQPRRPVYI